MSPEAFDYVDDGWVPDRPTLAKPAAVTNLANALGGKNLSAAAVRAFARAAARPDDMRRKLADPVELRVQGGTLVLVETRLWSASVLPHPANPREYGHRTYALGGDAGVGDVLLEPAAMPDGNAELVLDVATPDDLVARLGDAEARLSRANPLVEDLRVEGVLQPLTVVALTAHHLDGAAPATFLIAADGSSRISSVHQILRYSIADLAYNLEDNRKFRAAVNAFARSVQGRDWEDLSEAERAALRVLTVPARVVVGFRPEPRSSLPFHTAIRNFIGLTHIRPPKAYGRAVENEAKADAVLDSLSRPLRTRPATLDKREKSWLAGTASPAQIKKWGLPQDPDLRTAEIIRSILAGGAGTTRRVNDGIRSLTVEQRPKREDRVDIAVELILRPLRTSTQDDVAYIRPRRAVLQRMYRLPEIANLSGDMQLEGMPGSALTLKDLRDQALEEVAAGQGDGGRLADAQTELAIKAAYYMAVSETMALQREVFGGEDDDDDRSPAVVMRAMLSRPRGVLQAYEVIRAGRAGEPLVVVDENGARLRDDATALALTDDFVRQVYNGEVSNNAQAGAAAAARQWAVIQKNIETLKKSVRVMDSIPVYAGGPSFTEREGWQTKVVEGARRVIDIIDRKLAGWGDRFEEKSAAEVDDDD
ncbi:hypothetical protein [Amycolatopsis sp. NPDC003731]